MTETEKLLTELCEKAIPDHDEWSKWMNSLVDAKFKSGDYSYSKEETAMETEILWKSEAEMFAVFALLKKLLAERSKKSA